MKVRVSIRAPRAGRAATDAPSSGSGASFNPRAPRGTRSCRSTSSRPGSCFNPRAPRGTRYSPRDEPQWRSEFQSARPARDALSPPIVPVRTCRFQSARPARDALVRLQVPANPADATPGARTYFVSALRRRSPRRRAGSIPFVLSTSFLRELPGPKLAAEGTRFQFSKNQRLVHLDDHLDSMVLDPALPVGAEKVEAQTIFRGLELGEQARP